MTTEKTYTRYIRDGFQTEYDIKLSITNRNGISVYVNNVFQEVLTYEIVGSDKQLRDGVGKIIMPDAGSLNDSLLFYRDTEENRITNFDQSGRFNAELIDAELENILRMIQDNDSRNLTNLHLPVSYIRDEVNTEIPIPTKSSQYLKSILTGDSISFEFGPVDEIAEIEQAVNDCNEAVTKCNEAEEIAVDLNSILDLTGIEISVNALKDTKRYLLNSNASNLPVSERGLVEVHNTDQDIVQNYISYESENQYFRHSSDFGFSWYDWIKLNDQTSSGGGVNIIDLYSDTTGSLEVELPSDADIRNNDELIINTASGPDSTSDYVTTKMILVDYNKWEQRDSTSSLKYDKPYSPSPQYHKFTSQFGNIIKIQRKRFS